MFESSRGRHHPTGSGGPPPESSELDALVHRDRRVVLVALALTVGGAWLWLLLQGATFGPMIASSAPTTSAQGAQLFAGATLTWCVMMVAMMLPSATPMVLTFARAARTNAGTATPTALFAAAYLGSLGLVSIAAAGLQTFLVGIEAVEPDRLVFVHPTSSALVLITFGVYQLTPLKRICLEFCRAPGPFFIRYWREGPARPVSLGVLHALNCMGCAAMLIPMLFVAGVMNFFWVAALALELAIEKIAPRGDLIARILGAAAALTGLGLLVDQAFTRFP